MGEYAELSIDRDLDDYLSGEYEDEHPDVVLNFRTCRETDFDIIRGSGDIGILFRNYKVSLNVVVLQVRETSNAFLFRIDDDSHKQHGKCFWCPKSILKRVDNEKQVFYVPNWSRLTIIK